MFVRSRLFTMTTKHQTQLSSESDLPPMDTKEDKEAHHLESFDDARPVEEAAVSATFNKKVQKSAMMKVSVPCDDAVREGYLCSSFCQD